MRPKASGKRNTLTGQNVPRAGSPLQGLSNSGLAVWHPSSIPRSKKGSEVFPPFGTEIYYQKSIEIATRETYTKSTGNNRVPQYNSSFS